MEHSLPQHNKIADYVDAHTGELLFSETFYDPSVDPKEAARRTKRGESVAQYGGRLLRAER